MINSKPKVFISSTIYDFIDLRSAIGFWLLENGFEVRMSERNDFIKDSSENSYMACMKSIEDCDYFILLIGERVGGVFQEEPLVSITQQEYRCAYDLAQKGHIKKIITFVRKSLWDVKADHKLLRNYLVKQYCTSKDVFEEKIYQIINSIDDTSKYATDAKFIFNFIDEVAHITDMQKAQKGESEYPKNNWIHTFSDFIDIINTLKVDLNIYNDTTTRKWDELILREIANNISKVSHKSKSGYIFEHLLYGKQARKKLPNQMHESFNLTYDEGNELSFFCLLASTECVNLSINYIQQALYKGVYLTYVADKLKYIASNLHNALNDLYRSIMKIHNVSKIISDNLLKITGVLKCEKSNEITLNCLSNPLMAFPFVLVDAYENMFKLSNYIFAIVLTADDKYDYPELISDSCFDSTMDDIFLPPISRDEVYNYLSSLYLKGKI